MKAIFLAVTAALLLPTTATAASQYYIPPGNSAVSQYSEGVQTAGGTGVINRFTPRGDAANTGVSVSPAAPTQSGRQSGRPGARPITPVAASPRHPARRGAGGVVRSGNGGSSGGSAGGLPGGASAGGVPSGSSPLPKVLSAVTGFGTRDGLGTALPVALLAATAVLAVIALLRRRHLG